METQLSVLRLWAPRPPVTLALPVAFSSPSPEAAWERNLEEGLRWSGVVSCWRKYLRRE